MFGCKHKYDVFSEGYQYCEKCGKAIAAPKIECSHKWEEISNWNVRNNITNRITSKMYMMRCSICGDMKKVSTSDDN